MKTVLLTGATGFIGRHCLKPLLERGFVVHAVTTKAEGQLVPKVQWHKVDLLDPNQVQNLLESVQPTHLLHLAWYTKPGKYWTSTENFRWVQASIALLQAFSQTGGQRVVTAGTCAEYDWRFGYCSEGVTPLAPSTVYGTCKHALCSLTEVFAVANGLSCAWGRMFFLYGPGEHASRLVPSVVCSLLEGKQALCTHGNQVRDFLYVEDAADAFVALLDGSVTGSVNIASGQPVMVKDVIHRIAEKLGRPELIQLGAIGASSTEPRVLLADTVRLKNELEWTPNCDLDQGLDRTISFWDAQPQWAEA